MINWIKSILPVSRAKHRELLAKYSERDLELHNANRQIERLKQGTIPEKLKPQVSEIYRRNGHVYFAFEQGFGLGTISLACLISLSTILWLGSIRIYIYIYSYTESYTSQLVPDYYYISE